MSEAGTKIASDRCRELVALFHDETEQFGNCQVAVPTDVPPRPRALLDHTSHMTVAMERFHGGPVNLRVVARIDDGTRRYAREILLCQQDGRVVQHGIVRINLGLLPPATAAAIRSESAPLGRLLLEAGLLCDVHDVQLLRISVGPHLASIFGTEVGTEVFGRVATIDLDGRPVIELLEISAPVLG